MRLRAPDPTPREVLESRTIIESESWKRLVRVLGTWTSQHPSAAFNGDDKVTELRLWKRAMEKFFQAWAATNPVVQARLASISFRDKADLWWSAHCRVSPRRMVTFEQLAECVGRELVPQSRTSQAHLA